MSASRPATPETTTPDSTETPSPTQSTTSEGQPSRPFRKSLTFFSNLHEADSFEGAEDLKKHPPKTITQADKNDKITHHINAIVKAALRP